MPAVHRAALTRSLCGWVLPVLLWTQLSLPASAPPPDLPATAGVTDSPLPTPTPAVEITPTPTASPSAEATPPPETLTSPFPTPLTPTADLLTSPLPTPDTPAELESSGPLSPTRGLALAATASTNLNEGWRLLYNPPQVATFSGAATYNYPIELPPGRHGFQPTLNLSYNSRRLDGLLAWVQDWAGIGWSVDVMDIARTGLGFCWPGESDAVCMSKGFVLTLNGTGYSLVPETGVAEGQPGRYRAAEAPDLSLQLVNDPNTGNQNKWYWIVQTPDGTKYYLGDTYNSEQVMNYVYDNQGTYRWRLRYAVDLWGNAWQVTYREGSAGGFDYATVLSDLWYNSYGSGQWATHVVFQGTALGTLPGSILGDPGQLQAIEVWHLGQRMRRYQLSYATTPSPIYTRYLTAVQVYDSAGTSTLPATTFSYISYDNKPWCPNSGASPFEQTTFSYPRLTAVANGYGARTEFTYQIPRTLVNVDGCGSDPRVFSYRVAEQATESGLSGQRARTLYTYGPACYADNADFYFGSLCRSLYQGSNGEALVGHAVVTQTVLDYDGTTLQQLRQSFSTADLSPLLGREYQNQLWNASGQLLQQTNTVWGVQLLSVYPDATYWSEASSHQRSNDQVHSGQSALRSTFTSNSGGGVSTVSEPIAITPNTVYTLSGWIYKTATAGSAYIDMNDIPGELTLAATQNHQWQYVRGTWNSGTNTSLRLRLVTDGNVNGWVWFDDLALVSATAPATNLVPNPSFEASGTNRNPNSKNGLDAIQIRAMEVTTARAGQGLTATTRTAYTYDRYGNVLAEYDYGAEERLINAGFEDSATTNPIPGWNPFWTHPLAATQTTAVAWAGRASLELQGPTAGGAYQDVSGLISGTTYLVRARVRATPGTTGQFRLWLHDTQGHNTTSSPSFVPPTDWTEVTWPYTANATGQLRIHLYYVTPGAGAIYVDEVAVARLADVGDERVQYRDYFNLDNGTWLIGLPYREELYAGLGGQNALDVAFTNDYCVPAGCASGDRNLYVDAITVGNQVLQAESNAVRYDRGAGQTAFDGVAVLPGREVVSTFGALRTRVTTATGGAQTVVIRAKGSYADGWPVMQLRVDGAVVQTWVVSTADWADYTTVVTLTPGSQLATQSFRYYDDYTYEAARWGQSTQITRGLVTLTGQGLLGTTAWATTTYAYDAWGNPTVTTDTRGYATRTSYDSVYRLYPLQVCNALTQCTATAYYGLNGLPTDTGLAGQVKMVTDTNGIATTYHYDTFGRLRKVIRPGDSATQPTLEYQYTDGYNLNGLKGLRVLEILREQSGCGGCVQPNPHFYDGLGRLVQKRVEQQNGAIQSVTNYVYNASGQVVRSYLPAEETFTWEFTRTAGWDSRPRTATQYDALGHPVVVQGPDNSVTTAWYGATTTTEIDANGHRRDSVLDAAGQLVRAREYLSEPTLTPQVYEAEGSALSHLIGSASGGVWLSPAAGAGANTLTYGPYQAPAQSGPGQQARFRLARDTTGGADDVVVKIDVSDYTDNQRVLASRLLRRSDFLGGLNNFSEFTLYFDTTGRTGHSLEYRVYWYGTAQVAHDKTTLLWRQDGSYQETQYNYDVLGHLTCLTDTLGVTTVMTYDALGRKMAMRDPDMGLWSYQYDPAGNLTQQTDARGCVITFGYDPLNRLTGKSYSGSCSGVPVAYTYDAYDGTTQFGRGQRTGMTDATGSTAWTYDVRGRVTREVKTITGVGAFTTTTTYDALDRVVTQTYPDGEVVTTTYNAAGLPNTLSGASTYVTNAVYNALGQPTSVALGNGLTTAYTYRADNFRLQQLQVSNLLNLQYTYDPVGNVKTITDTTNSNQVQTFTYDALDRLVAASTNGVGQGQYQESYTYGPTGNLLTKNGVTYGYSDPAHVHAVTHLTGTQRYWYDANGNMTSRAENGLTYTQVWNAENRPSVITATPTAAVTRFWYDGDGALVKKEVTTSQGVTTTLYLSQLYEVQLTAPAGGTGQSTPPPLPLTAAPATSEAAGRAPTQPAPDLPLVPRRTPIPLVPTPVLYPLPAYTAGTANTVEWEFDETLQYQARRVPTANCDDEAAVDSPWLGQSYYVFTGLTHGVTYYYCVRAWKPILNLYSEWAGPIFSTQDAVAPTAQIGALPEYHWQNTVTVSWSGSDDGSGLAATPFEVQFQQDGGAWQPWLYTPNTTSTFTGVAGHVYTFRVRSQDQVGNLSAWSVSTPIMLTFSRVTIYYYFNGQRIAVRERTGTANTLTYLHADHLGSAALATTVTGTLLSQRRYLPYGETRWSSDPFPTDRRFTGQREEVTLGVYDYGARLYAPGLGRFLSADTLVPEAGRPQSLNRYAYVLGNPLRYTDPTGHFTRDEIVKYCDAENWEEVLSFFEKGGKWEGRWGWLAVLNRALLGDSIEILTRLPNFWQPSPPETLFYGQFIEMDGQLYLRPDNGKIVPFGFAGSLGEAYLTHGSNTRGWGSGYIDAYHFSYAGVDPSHIDWTGMVFDAAGLLADVIPPGGLGGRAVNILQAGYKGIDVMKVLGEFDAVRGIIRNSKDGNFDWGDVGDTALSVGGIFIPIWCDAASLINNFSQSFYEVPIQEVVYGKEFAPTIKGR